MSTPQFHFVTTTAPVNMAVIKYWGKTDEINIIPANSSISATLSQDTMRSTTTAMASKEFKQDRLWLDGHEEEITDRMRRCFAKLRENARDIEREGHLIKKEDWSQYHFHICSKNNFPTAAGLASSASGFACLVKAVALLVNVDESAVDLTTIARLGSGSACRSLAGGFVKWEMGTDPTTSRAVQVVDEKYWPEIGVLICIASDTKKTVSSTSGMQTTVQTSELFRHRIEHVVPKRMEAMEAAIRARDFETFGRITMEDSNQFHSVCLDTYPPIFYLTDVSRGVITLVHKFNEQQGGIKVAYTFDAGPNAAVFGPMENLKKFVPFVQYFFPFSSKITTGHEEMDTVLSHVADPESVAKIIMPVRQDGLRGLKYCPIGDGPRVLTAADSLLNTVTGMPL